MASVVLILWAGIVLDSGVCSDSLPEITDGKFIDDCVGAHNRARSAVSPPASNMLYMTWDEGLAITARAWARYCLFEHNTFLKDVKRVHPNFSSVGENLWAGSPPSHFNVMPAIKLWVDEKQHYDFSSKYCRPGKICGHYTQVVWASSHKVGCAAQLCPNGVKHTNFADKAGVIFVCNYAPAGNVNRGKPYESQGEPCSRCKGTCVENLCRSQERDSQKSYNWSPDWDPARTTSDPNNGASSSNYVPILVVRPIALILTFVAAYVIHHFYPDVFFYE